MSDLLKIDRWSKQLIDFHYPPIDTANGFSGQPAG
jgi:hypothetical protein